MVQLLQRHYDEVSQAEDEAALHKALVSFAHELDFGQVSVLLLRGEPGTPGVWGRSVGNPPAGYSAIATNKEFFGRDPLMGRLRAFGMPLAWDQDFYAAAGCGDIWEAFAPFGYKTGVALGIRLTTADQLFLGVDRDAALPGSEIHRMRLAADLQLLAAHAQVAMCRLFKPPEAANETLPPLTPREREALALTASGMKARAVAQVMGLSERGVHFHLQNAMRKLDVRSKEAAVLKCVQGGLISG